ncbi:DUF998 domain-containing protein [Dictyobacter formicarum]|nr:DUF998 domain-containing protein [Dictyobacter formicarum]
MTTSSMRTSFLTLVFAGTAILINLIFNRRQLSVSRSRTVLNDLKKETPESLFSERSLFHECFEEGKEYRVPVGLRRIWRTGRGSVWGPLLIGLFGLGLLIAGVFVIDPGEGYPPGASLNGSLQTWHGWIHGINGLLFFNVVLPAACFVLSRRFAADPQSHRWARYSWMTGALILVLSIPISTFILPFAVYAGLPVGDGFVQRIEIIMGWGWMALTALHLLREVRKARVGQNLKTPASEALVGAESEQPPSLS